MLDIIKNYWENDTLTFIWICGVVAICVILASYNIIKIQLRKKWYAKNTDLVNHLYNRYIDTHLRVQGLKYFSYEKFSDTLVRSVSRVVFNNAKKDFYKYVLKYCIPNHTSDTLEKMKNYFEAETKYNNDLQSLINVIRKYDKEYDSLPFYIKSDKHKQFKSLFTAETTVYNHFSSTDIGFTYTSPQGRNHETNLIQLNKRHYNIITNEISKIVNMPSKDKQKIERNKMTPKLREEILERDNYTCQICGISQEDEPHLLLEVDHIVPIAKGGLTVPENLQTLCWKCNRSKGAKL